MSNISVLNSAEPGQITEIEGLVRENNRLKGENKACNVRIADLADQLSKASVSAAKRDMGEITLNARLAAAEKKNDELSGKYCTMQRELEEAKDARRASKKLYDGQVEYNNKLLSDLEYKKRDFDEKTKELEGLKAEYNSQVRIKNAQEVELSDVKKKYEELKKYLAKKEEESIADKAKIIADKEKISELESNTKKFKDEIGAVKTECDRFGREYERVSQELSTACAENGRLSLRAEQSEKGLVAARVEVEAMRRSMAGIEARVTDTGRVVEKLEQDIGNLDNIRQNFINDCEDAKQSLSLLSSEIKNLNIKK
jgi:chromosome segregation ATPase